MHTPQIRLACSIRINSTVRAGRVPFIIKILKRFSKSSALRRPHFGSGGFIRMSLSAFSRIVSNLTPHTAFQMDGSLDSGNNRFTISLTFGDVGSFHPRTITSRVRPLGRLMRTQSHLTSLHGGVSTGRGLRSLLSSILGGARRIGGVTRRGRASNRSWAVGTRTRRRVTASPLGDRDCSLLRRVIGGDGITGSSSRGGHTGSRVTRLTGRIVRNAIALSSGLTTSVSTHVTRVSTLVSGRLAAIVRTPRFRGLRSD